MPAQLPVKLTKLLADLKLAMPVTVQVEDPFTREPLVISYENLHELLVLNIDSLLDEQQAIGNLYAEMGRLEGAAKWEAAKSEIRLRKWKHERIKELSDSSEHAKKKPTKEQGETYYRTHKDYEEKSLEGKRWEVIAGVLNDLKWAFKMKGDQSANASRLMVGYEAIGARRDRVEDGAERVRSEYIDTETALTGVGSTDESAEALRTLLQQPPPDPQSPPNKQPRTLDG